jgi:hypothetical protein
MSGVILGWLTLSSAKKRQREMKKRMKRKRAIEVLR